MRDGWRERYRALLDRLRRFERREVREFRAWLEHTRNLLHLSILFLLPLLLGLVTLVANAIEQLPFLLFPPLAAGTYTLFAQPESKYASPRRFVGGLTGGAACGWVALELSARYWYRVPPESFSVHAGAVAFGIFLTGVFTWALDMEEASAFSAALLVHVTPPESQVAYVGSVALSSTLVAAVFVAWRRLFFEKRADYLYESTKGDDHVLVPMRSEAADATAMLAARLAAAHEAGKVVLLDIVETEWMADAQRRLVDHRVERLDTGLTADGGGPTPAGERSGTERVDESSDGERESRAERDHADGGGGSLDQATLDEMARDRAVASAATRLEERASQIETQAGVPCEVVIAVDTGSPASTVLRTAHQANCDLIATPYEERHGTLSPFVRSLFGGDTDVLVHRSRAGRTRWTHAMVPVRRAGDVAHAMIDFALRLTGQTGHVSVCHCIDRTGDRRRAEEMLADLVEPIDGPLETRVSRQPIEEFLGEQSPGYDIAFIGASMDRSAASRFVSPPTFERIQDLDCDVAIVDRNY